MGYRLTRNEAPGDGLRRVAGEVLTDAAILLRAPPEGDAAVAVHEARKATKKARAALRIGRELLAKKRRRALDRALRDAARALAPSRDAEVRQRTAREAASAARLSAPDEAFQAWLADTAAEAAVDAVSAPAAPGPVEPDRLAAHADAFERLRGELEAARWRSGGAKALRKGLARLYARGRAAQREIGGTPDAEALHACRRNTKRIEYALRLLEPAWPPVVAAEAQEVHRLNELLGRDHDLALLRATLVRHDRPATRTDPDALAAWLDDEIARGRTQALALLRRVYAEPPDGFASRYAGWWSAWRTGAGGDMS